MDGADFIAMCTGQSSCHASNCIKYLSSLLTRVLCSDPCFILSYKTIKTTEHKRKKKQMWLWDHKERYSGHHCPTPDLRTAINRIEVICFKHISKGKHTCIPKLSGIPHLILQFIYTEIMPHKSMQSHFFILLKEANLTVSNYYIITLNNPLSVGYVLIL